MGFNIADTGKKRVVIIGGGFGGLKLANRLKGSNFQIVLIDKNNYHQFPAITLSGSLFRTRIEFHIFPFSQDIPKTEKLLFPACRSESDRTGKEPCADLYRRVEI